MTGHKFKGELCAYCCEAASAADDHVLARGFVLSGPQRHGMPQAPACNRCNGLKSKLENELMQILGLVGRREDAIENALESERRLANKANSKILGAIRAGMSTVVVVEDGVEREAIALPADWEQIGLWLRYMARGLAWYHFSDLRFVSGVDVSSFFLTESQGAGFEGFRHGRTQNVVEGNLGNGVLSYWGAQAHDNPHLTIWKFIILGGLKTEGSNDEPINGWVRTGPPRANSGGVVDG